MNTSSLTIRTANQADIDRIAEIEGVCFPAAEAAPKQTIRMRYNAYSKGFFVAEIDQEIIGFINGAAFDADKIEDHYFESMDAHDDANRSLVIFGLDVHPNYQNKGIAAQLMRRFIEFGKNEDKEQILLICKDHLIKYYEQFGYQNDGLSDSVHGGAQWYDMSLKLKG